MNKTFYKTFLSARCARKLFAHGCVALALITLSACGGGDSSVAATTTESGTTPTPTTPAPTTAAATYTDVVYASLSSAQKLDVYVPEGIAPLVCIGQRAICGETVLADIDSTESQREGIIVKS